MPAYFFASTLRCFGDFIPGRARRAAIEFLISHPSPGEREPFLIASFSRRSIQLVFLRICSRATSRLPCQTTLAFMVGSDADPSYKSLPLVVETVVGTSCKT